MATRSTSRSFVFFALATAALTASEPARATYQTPKFKYWIEVPVDTYSRPSYGYGTALETAVAQSSYRGRNVDLVDFLHQPQAGEFEIEIGPAIGRRSILTTTSAGAARSDVNAYAMSLALRAGVSRAFSLGISADFGQENIAPSAAGGEGRTSGWSDLNLGLQAHHGFTRQTRGVYGLAVRISPDRRMPGGYDLTGAEIVGTRSSGGHGIAPSFGLQTEFGSRWLLAGQARIEILQERRTSEARTYLESKESPHNEAALALIVERKLEGAAVGGVLAHNWAEAYNSTTQFGQVTHIHSQNTLTASLYGTRDFDKLTVKPVLTHETLLGRPRDMSARTDRFESTTLQVLFRRIF